jgi:hypothetical protein
LSIIRQRASWGLFVDVDHEKVENRMILRGLLNEKKKPKTLFIITQLKEHEIVTKYRQMIEGLFNYYVKQITFKSSLSRYYFYLHEGRRPKSGPSRSPCGGAQGPLFLHRKNGGRKKIFPKGKFSREGDNQRLSFPEEFNLRLNSDM